MQHLLACQTTAVGKARRKAARFVGGVTVLAAVWWIPTYVPGIQDMLPNLIVAPPPTITVELTDADIASGQIPADPVNAACHDIPLILRPIASRPDSVKVILSYQRVARGDVVLSCHDGHQISTHKY